LAHFFKHWSAASDEFLARRSNTISSSKHPSRFDAQPGVFVLRIWRILVEVVLSVDPSGGETSWDPFANELKSIMDLASSFIDHTAKWIPGQSSQYDQPPNISMSAFTQTHLYSRSGDGIQQSVASHIPPLAPESAPTIKPIVSLSLGIVAPLYMVSIRCRDPAVRERAIHLWICNRREGLLDSRLNARIARRILKFEEDGARQYLHDKSGKHACGVVKPVEITSMMQIPEHLRVMHVGTSFGPEGKAQFDI
jgi:hypothetical protein